MRILIAEDNKVNQRVVKLILKKLGYEGEVVENGHKAVEAYEAAYFSDPYDLILMDIQMPVMDGIEASRKIRELESPGKECCIIAVSANVLDETRQEAMQAGFNDYLCKPIKYETLKHSFEQAWFFLKRMSKEKRETLRGVFFSSNR